MLICCFEELIAWQRAQDLATAIYAKFIDTKEFAFKDQICRAALSISNNIAEGFDRSSRIEFKRFLFYALGSCSEVRSMLYLSVRIGICNSEEASSLIEKSKELSRIINGLIASINKKKN